MRAGTTFVVAAPLSAWGKRALPDRRRSRRELTPPPHDPRREAGERLKRAIHVARARKGLTSDTSLSVQSGISYDTLYNWYSGRTRPRGKELRQLADFLGMAYSELEAVYEGRDPEPLPLQDAVRDLIRSLDDLVAELRLTRAEQLVSQEMMADALREVERRGISRGSTRPTPRPRPVEGR